MVQQGLVEKKPVGNERIAYNITPRGSSILHTFNKFKKMLPVEEPSGQLKTINQIY